MTRKWAIGFSIILFFLWASNSAIAKNSKEVVRIYLSPIPPLVMLKDDQFSGVLWDLAVEIKTRLEASHGTTLQILPSIVPWNRAYSELQKSNNILMLQIAPTPQRETLFKWVAQTGQLSFAFVSKQPPRINSLNEAHKSSKIAVYRGSHLERFLRSKGFGSSLELTEDSETGARLLDAGRVDSWYASVQEALWLKKSGILKSKPVFGDPINTIPIWAAASKTTSAETLTLLSDAINDIKKKGQLDFIRNLYGLDQLSTF